MTKLDDIIKKFKDLHDVEENVCINCEKYEIARIGLTNYIYENNLNETKMWKTISDCLVYRTYEVLSVEKYNRILIELENLRRFVLNRINEPFWQYIHPLVKKVSENSFQSGSYADSVENAFKEVNSRVKKIYKRLKPLEEEKDGADLMNHVFSVNSPLVRFEDNHTESGKNVQKGYLQIFAGSITGIRNPKAHENMMITKEQAIKRLVFASLLMDKIDEGINFSKITE